MDKPSFFELPAGLPRADEFIETVAEAQGFRVERIISHGHRTPDGQWYNQPADEWVILLQGEATLEWEDGRKTQLVAGDSLMIPAHERHRVHHTSDAPPRPACGSPSTAALNNPSTSPIYAPFRRPALAASRREISA